MSGLLIKEEAIGGAPADVQARAAQLQAVSGEGPAFLPDFKP